VKLRQQRLDFVLKKYLPDSTKIDFLNIDAEGQDEDVLLSNDWKFYRPEFIAVEVGPAKTVEEIEGSNLSELLRQYGYRLYSRLFNTAFFMRMSG
jgi:hypothetical protein